MKTILILLLSTVPLAIAQENPPCRWGLAPNTACRSLEREAAQRMAAAKTSCMSSDSGVTWSKTLKNPNTDSTMRSERIAYLDAHGRYQPLATCRNADLVFKFEVDKGNTAELTVVDTESGEWVFHEWRSTSDEDADLHRLALHFLNASRAAKVINETYASALRAGCTLDAAFKVLADYSDADLVGKHFSCRDGSETSAQAVAP
jgi:hypothetical protein